MKSEEIKSEIAKVQEDNATVVKELKKKLQEIHYAATLTLADFDTAVEDFAEYEQKMYGSRSNNDVKRIGSSIRQKLITLIESRS